jgi:membrane protease YdiL (CAAX protease family)
MAHLALGKVVLVVLCLGLLLVGLAAWRRSLVPGMLLHAGFDLVAGLIRHV